MNPIPYYYDSIDRNAIVVKPKMPLFDWINTIYPDSPVEDAFEGTIYLAREKNSNEEIEKWLQENYDSIFQDQLNGWHTDEKDWPKNRTYQQFTQWFAFEIHSMVLDLEDEPVTKG